MVFIDVPFEWICFFLLLCELFRVHEMRSQLEVTEMLECKPYCVAPSFRRNTLLHKSCGLCNIFGRSSTIEPRSPLLH